MILDQCYILAKWLYPGKNVKIQHDTVRVYEMDQPMIIFDPLHNSKLLYKLEKKFIKEAQIVNKVVWYARENGHIVKSSVLYYNGVTDKPVIEMQVAKKEKVAIFNSILKWVETNS